MIKDINYQCLSRIDENKISLQMFRGQGQIPKPAPAQTHFGFTSLGPKALEK